MIRFLSIVIGLCALLAPQLACADLRVVATTPDLAAVARAVGGERVKVSALALHTQDPHFVDARPHLALELARADLLLAVGLGLEVGWLPTLQTGSRNGRVQRGAAGYLDCSRFIDKLDVPAGKVDRSMGDVHPGGSPHYMLDPRRAARVVVGVAARMAELDPAHAAHYRAGGDRTARALQAARAGWEKRLAAKRGSPIVAYHRSFAYLADWLGLEVIAHVEPKPGVPPSPRHIARVLTAARAQGAKVILQESFYPTNASRAVAERAGARVLTLHAGPDLGRGQDYLAFMGELVKRLEGAL